MQMRTRIMNQLHVVAQWGRAPEESAVAAGGA